jgi:hypothetical protein
MDPGPVRPYTAPVDDGALDGAGDRVDERETSSPPSYEL